MRGSGTRPSHLPAGKGPDQPAGPGSVLGRYQLMAPLGKGGMGTVYAAVHRELNKRVVIKVLNPELADNQAARTRFWREGEAAGRIRHPHVVDVIDVDAHQGLPFLVMEHLDGENLAAHLARRGPLAVDEAVGLMLPVIAGVAAGHDQGVIHRDLKPHNIFLARTADGETVPKVLDFGIAKLLDNQGHSVNLTLAGAVFGSAAYMSPEQARADPGLGPASDQYALGALLYECLTGQPAYPGDSTFDVLARVAQGRFPPPRQLVPALPAGLEAVILRAMALMPARRFPSLGALGQALVPFATPRVRVLWQSGLAPPDRPAPTPAGEKLSPLFRAADVAVLALLAPLIMMGLLTGAPRRPLVSPAAAPALLPGQVCGVEAPDVSSIRNVRGLAIDGDGTLYFSQEDARQSWVGRLRPGGHPVEPRWLPLPAASGISALAVDAGRRALYVASVGGARLQTIDLRASPPAVRDLLTGIDGEPRGLAIDEAGNVYYSHHRDRLVFRVTPRGVATPVTTGELVDDDGQFSRPVALAFGPQGDLFVGTNTADLFRLQLQAGRETARSLFGNAGARGGGLAFDLRGRLYLAEYWPGRRSLFRIEADGSRFVAVGEGTQLGPIAFGRGSLDCRDLYVASGDGPLQRIRTDTPGYPPPDRSAPRPSSEVGNGRIGR
jgi:eukaryotic-like serine/threonine-protein kinase